MNCGNKINEDINKVLWKVIIANGIQSDLLLIAGRLFRSLKENSEMLCCKFWSPNH